MSALHKHFVLQMLGRARFRSDHTPQRRYNEATEMNGIPTFEPRRRAYQSGSWLAANSSWLGSHFLPRAPVRGGSSQNPKRLKTAGGLLNEACESAHAHLAQLRTQKGQQQAALSKSVALPACHTAACCEVREEKRPHPCLPRRQVSSSPAVVGCCRRLGWPAATRARHA